MAGSYRALLIGNSTYPADEHNLQTLRGPVKDIAVLNRALVDRETGLFADVDVTLLPEATSTRTIRALSKFFGAANRDDVLLVYFSGHGKLDLNGRLHLCMQDTEITELLSTAVSSTRINEFAEASRARNVVIVLDCCYAGAFRGGDLGESVAGPGRYVMSSCRGSQLANDATIENGTSYFTEHLVDGLLNATDQDGDGYISFSDLYAHVDRRLREAGKQIPQRRVDGDGDLRLARRPARPVEANPPVLDVFPSRLDLVDVPPGHAVSVRVANRGGGQLGWSYDAAADFYTVERTSDGLLLRLGTRPGRHDGQLAIRSNGGHADVLISATIRAGAAAQGSASVPDDAEVTTKGGSPAATARSRRLLVAGGGALVLLAGAVTAVVLSRSNSGGSSGAAPKLATPHTIGAPYTATAPWRLHIKDDIQGDDVGCTVAVTDIASGATTPLTEWKYGTTSVQLHQTGTFRVQANDVGCLATPLAGSGTAVLPFAQDHGGDSDAFAPSPRVAVQAREESHGNSGCRFRLYDPATGQELDVAQARSATDTVILNASGHRSVYVNDGDCAIRVSAAP